MVSFKFKLRKFVAPTFKWKITANFKIMSLLQNTDFPQTRDFDLSHLSYVLELPQRTLKKW